MLEVSTLTSVSVPGGLTSSVEVPVTWRSGVFGGLGRLLGGALHSEALCLDLPQYRQRLLSMRYLRSCGVSLPHFLNEVLHPCVALMSAVVSATISWTRVDHQGLP